MRNPLAIMKRIMEKRVIDPAAPFEPIDYRPVVLRVSHKEAEMIVSALDFYKSFTPNNDREHYKALSVVMEMQRRACQQ